jgi:hypothetical protein
LQLSTLAGVLALAVTTLLTAPVAGATELSCYSWSVVNSPDVVSQNNFLNGVTAVSANNVWAVGYSLSSGFSLTLVDTGTARPGASSPAPTWGRIAPFYQFIKLFTEVS